MLSMNAVYTSKRIIIMQSEENNAEVVVVVNGEVMFTLAEDELGSWMFDNSGFVKPLALLKVAIIEIMQL